LALFLDFDGTLVDIAARPQDVIVDPGLPALLDRLRRRCDGALAIVTGRSVEAIEHFLPGLGLDICGLHGMERRIAGSARVLEAKNLSGLRAAVPALTQKLAQLPGVLIEDKGESVALHWRLNPEAEPIVVEAAHAAMAAIGAGFRLQAGKALVEIVPDVSGKGGAITSLMEQPPYRGRTPFFIGDDVTDEHGFAAVSALGGLSLKIGPGESLATRRLPDPTTLRGWLGELAAGRQSVESLPAA
jgi:trehalose 6-phosphate phosphatase